MTNTKKITNKFALQYVLDNCEVPTEISEKLEKMIVSLDKKSSSNGEKKLTAVQKENIGFMEIMYNALDTEKGKTVTEIIKSVPEFAEFSNQKASALMKKLVDEGRAVKQVDKGRSYFLKA